jgi:hypothetical protein
LTGVPPPDNGGPEELRVKRAAVYAHSCKPKAGREHAPGEFVDRLRSRFDLERGAKEPIGYRVDGVPPRTIGRRAFEDLGRVDVRLYRGERGRSLCRICHLVANPADRYPRLYAALRVAMGYRKNWLNASDVSRNACSGKKWPASIG